MKVPWLDFILLIVILLGALSTWRSATALSEVRAEYERLRLITGELDITNPAKIYVRALPTDAPLEFAWRVYLPANYRLYVHDGSGSSSRGSNSEARQTIIRVRFRKLGDRIYVYQHLPSSSGLGGLNSPTEELVRDRMDELEVEQLGKNQVEEFDQATAFTLLKLRLSEKLQGEAMARKIEGTRLPEVYGVYFGPPTGP